MLIPFIAFLETLSFSFFVRSHLFAMRLSLACVFPMLIRCIHSALWMCPLLGHSCFLFSHSLVYCLFHCSFCALVLCFVMLFHASVVFFSSACRLRPLIVFVSVFSPMWLCSLFHKLLRDGLFCLIVRVCQPLVVVACSAFFRLHCDVIFCLHLVLCYCLLGVVRSHSVKVSFWFLLRVAHLVS